MHLTSYLEFIQDICLRNNVWACTALRITLRGILKTYSSAEIKTSDTSSYITALLNKQICLAGAVLTHSPLTAATWVRYPASACEMLM